MINRQGNVQSAPRCFLPSPASHVAQRKCVRLKGPSDQKDAAAVDHVIQRKLDIQSLSFVSSRQNFA